MSVEVSLDPALQLALRGASALLFGSAAAHKLHDPIGFRDALGAYGLLPEATLAPSVATLIVAEAAITVGCVVPASAAGACLAGALLLALYSAAIGINLARGRRTIDCGCDLLGFIPGGNGTIGITSPLSTHRREFFSEFGRFFGRNSSERTACEQRAKCIYGEHFSFHHFLFLIYKWASYSYRLNLNCELER